MIHLSRRFALWRQVIVAVVIVFVGAAAAAARAADVFHVTGVEVDVQAEDAVAAREQAIVEGERKAFDVLLERMTQPEARARLAQIDPLEISAAVRDMSIAKEKASAVRYLATFEFRFYGDKVRDLLQRYGVSSASVRKDPVLIVPVFRAGGASDLWVETNPWREAWSQRARLDAPLPMILPLGDLGDIGAITAEEAERGDEAGLSALTRRYQVQDALVAVAGLEGGDAGQQRLQVDVFRFDGERISDRAERSFVAEADEQQGDFLVRTVDALILEEQRGWKQKAPEISGPPAVAPVAVPISSLQQWLGIRDRLASIPIVSRVDLILLSRWQALVNVHFSGTAEDLDPALNQAGFGLVFEQGQWLLKPAQRAPYQNL